MRLATIEEVHAHTRDERERSRKRIARMEKQTAALNAATARDREERNRKRDVTRVRLSASDRRAFKTPEALRAALLKLGFEASARICKRVLERPTVPRTTISTFDSEAGRSADHRIALKPVHDDDDDDELDDDDDDVDDDPIEPVDEPKQKTKPKTEKVKTMKLDTESMAGMIAAAETAEQRTRGTRAEVTAVRTIGDFAQVVAKKEAGATWSESLIVDCGSIK